MSFGYATSLVRGTINWWYGASIPPRSFGIQHGKLWSLQWCRTPQPISLIQPSWRRYMPLTAKGNEIMESMKKQYGEKKGESVFYASKNKGRITGVDEGRWGGRASDRAGDRDALADGGGSGQAAGYKDPDDAGMIEGVDWNSIVGDIADCYDEEGNYIDYADHGSYYKTRRGRIQS